jgi:hypothetical protein
MCSSVYIDPELSDEERRAGLYAGDIVVLSPTLGTRALVFASQSNAGERLRTS